MGVELGCLIKIDNSMEIIEKIEIGKFRSFGQGNKKKVKIKCESLNIYSGKNNSGKSNILKALNLFFNNEVSFNEEFDFRKDFNKAYYGKAGGKREIKIKIFFIQQGAALLSKGFCIEKIFDKNGGITENFFYKHGGKYKKAKSGREQGQFRTFLSKVRYIYVPAVREKKFIKKIFIHLQLVLDKKSKDAKKYKDAFNELDTLLIEKTEDLSIDFNKFIDMEATVSAPRKITDILEGISIQTDPGIIIEKKIKGKYEKIPQKISTDQSGDGVIMSYLPHFLDFLAKKLTGNFFLWGFEEPENSLEYSKVQKISKLFLNDFTKKSQIFLTTHSPSFISLKDEEKVILYRVYKELSDDRLSIVKTEDAMEIERQKLITVGEPVLAQKLDEEIGFIEFSRDSEKIIQERKEILKKSKKIEEEIEKNTLFVEGELEKFIFNKIFKKKGININVKYAKSANGVMNKIIMMSRNIRLKYIVNGLVDSDDAGRIAKKGYDEHKRENDEKTNIFHLKLEKELKDNIINKVKIDFSIDELLPEFIWEYLDANSFLEKDTKKVDEISKITPGDISRDEFIKEELSENKIDILKMTKKVKLYKKNDLLEYIKSLNNEDFDKISDNLKWNLKNIEDRFKFEQ